LLQTICDQPPRLRYPEHARVGAQSRPPRDQPKGDGPGENVGSLLL